MGDVFVIERGGSPRPIEEYITRNENGINWIKIGDTKGVTKYIYKTNEKIKPEGLKRSRMVYEDDFILSNSMSFGRPYIMKTTGCIHDGWLVIRKNENIDNNFLYYLLSSSSVYAQFSKLAKGSTVKNLNIEAVNQVKIPVPPIKVQQVIVSKIEKLFSELDKGIESLKLALHQLKVYRQSVLKWAFEGRLSNEHVKEGELPEGWTRSRLGNVANAIDPQPSHRTPPVETNGVPFVSIKDFDSDLDKIDFTSARKVSQKVLNEHLDRYTLVQGDFVIGKIGTIGKPVRIVLPQDYCLSANIVLIQPRNIDSTYLYYFFQSSIIEKAFTSGTKATTQAAFGIQKVRELVIELPKKPEQINIVEEIERRLSEADKMEESINQSLQQSEVMRQSILKRAFEGKLTNDN